MLPSSIIGGTSKPRILPLNSIYGVSYGHFSFNTFSIDNVNARINNKPAKMDVPARLVNGKTMVPLRFLSENMGYDVDWDADSRTAIVNS